MYMYFNSNKHLLAFFYVVVANLIVGSIIFPKLTLAQSADYVFTGCKVYTVNEKQPWAEAFAVKRNKIVYVGDVAGAKVFIGGKTKEVDTSGQMVLPGFISGHDHLTASNWTKAGVDLFSARSKAEYLLMIKEYTDLVILEKNLFNLKAEAISDVKVLATIMDGKYTYKADE